MPKRVAKRTTKKAVKKTRPGLSFAGVVASVSRLHTEFLHRATKAINVSLTLRNWIIGAYIHEYELRGADRAKYGENLVPELAETLTKRKIPGCDPSSLYRHLRFFRFYPQIFQTLSGKLQVYGIRQVTQNSILETLSPELQLLDNKGVVQNPILETLSPELQSTGIKRLTSEGVLGTLALKTTDNASETENDDIPQHSGDEILEKLSYSHIVQLVGIDDPYKRVFYEMECLRGGWSVRELKRQISTLYFERTALSTNKAKLREIVKKKAETYEPRMVVRDPMVFEFLGIRPSEAMLEEEIEQRMLDRLQETLLELGHGFCFEARQKRLLIGKEHCFVDLVFYHRVLKCHILVELKNDDFRHEYIGQLNTYLTWYTKNVMAEGDQPPVGILLCTGKDETLVEYALAGMSNKLFVSRYLAQLPTREELLRITREE